MLIPPKPESNGHADRDTIVETLAHNEPPPGYRIVDLPSERCWEPAGQNNHAEGDVEELHASLDKHGQMVPAIAGEREDMPDHYWIYDGNGRLAWVRAAETVTCRSARSYAGRIGNYHHPRYHRRHQEGPQWGRFRGGHASLADAEQRQPGCGG